jgi:hypothetical protein
MHQFDRWKPLSAMSHFFCRVSNRELPCQCASEQLRTNCSPKAHKNHERRTCFEFDLSKTYICAESWLISFPLWSVQFTIVLSEKTPRSLEVGDNQMANAMNEESSWPSRRSQTSRVNPKPTDLKSTPEEVLRVWWIGWCMISWWT